MTNLLVGAKVKIQGIETHCDLDLTFGFGSLVVSAQKAVFEDRNLIKAKWTGKGQAQNKEAQCELHHFWSLSVIMYGS